MTSLSSPWSLCPLWFVPIVPGVFHFQILYWQRSTTLNTAYSFDASCLSLPSIPISLSPWTSKVLLHTCLPWQRTPGMNGDGVFRTIIQNIPGSYHSNPILEGFWLLGSWNCGGVKIPIPRSHPWDISLWDSLTQSVLPEDRIKL